MKKHLRFGWGFAFGLAIFLFHHVVEPVDDGWVILGQFAWILNYIYDGSGANPNFISPREATLYFTINGKSFSR